MTEQKIKLTEEEIKARLKVVCICKGIKQSTICDAILKNPNCKIEDINKKTKSGSGGCKGTRCAPVIQKLIDQGGKPLLKPHEEKKEDDF